MNPSIIHKPDLAILDSGMCSLSKNKRLPSVHWNLVWNSEKRSSLLGPRMELHDLPGQPQHSWRHLPAREFPIHLTNRGLPLQPQSLPFLVLFNLCPSFPDANWQKCLLCTICTFPGSYQWGKLTGQMSKGFRNLDWRDGSLIFFSHSN